MKEVEEHICYTDNVLNELEMQHIKPMSHLCQKTNCNCKFCKNQELESDKFLFNLESLNSNVYSMNELIDSIQNEITIISSSLNQKKHPYHIVSKTTID